MAHERPMKLYQADLLELDIESVKYHFEHYLFEGHEITEDIKKFCEWCIEHDKKMLYEKRSGDSKNFLERREEGKKAIKGERP